MTRARDVAGITALANAKGDLYTATADNTPGVLTVGTTNGHVLQVDSTAATGLKWAAPTTSPTGYSLLNAGGTALTGAATITISGISAKQLLILVSGASADASSTIGIRFNGDTANNYSGFGYYASYTSVSTYSANDFSKIASYSSLSAAWMGDLSNTSSSTLSGAMYVDLADTTGWKRYINTSGIDSAGSATGSTRITQGFYEASAAITSVSIFSAAGNFDAGTIYILGA